MSSPNNREASVAREALERLRRGNARFAAGAVKAPRRDVTRREDVASEQNPFAVVLSCADSRAAPELVFDQGLGDLLVARNAGNVVGSDVAATVEFGILTLGARLVVVMGHEDCGAVSAALDSAGCCEGHPENLRTLLEKITLEIQDARQDNDGREAILSAAVEANVRRSVERLGETVQRLREDHLAEIREEILVVGAVYDLATGGVRFLD